MSARVEIINSGSRAALLVLPGERSDLGQMPTTRWEIRRSNRQLWTPPLEGRCGTYPDHKESDFFTLHAGQTKQFEESAYISGIAPGNYQMRFFFLNKPPKKSRKTFRQSDPNIDALLRNTTSCNLASDWVDFSVR